MIGKKVLESEPVSMAEVKEILEKFGEDHELTYEQNLVLDHVTRFSRLDPERSRELVEELMDIPNIKRRHAVKIADIMPVDISDLRLIFAKERVPIKANDLPGILEVIDKYRVE
ncbi:DNA-directed RNA polymerase subunit F [Methanothermobacter thermautotrophicus]|uniref:DNA-directed RNA polymerase subunit Rpo4 n=1 Tax=Methanothermobacter thermautotrophicus TaxID=145262 RepID=A0A842YQ86_METTF|nr:DNA-directed RNA polymerase subunit F [Methanothermobacter thermautotrophicus]MBE2900093.1 DNA-directed RNA polymerase subunit F [Methanothermobacter thermautotrophicus]MCQ8905774.1 DNA-directed RNA polymerase subunit F [Methanothermobacter sp.]